MEGCLTVKVKQIRDPVVARIDDVGEHVQCDCLLVEHGINIVVSAKSEHIAARATDVAEHLKVCCSFVCDVDTTEKYLDAVPTMVWLTPEMVEGEFDIISNVNWIIN